MALTDEQEAAMHDDIKDIERNLSKAKEKLGFLRANSVPYDNGEILVEIPQAQKDAEEVLLRDAFNKIGNKADHAKAV